MSKGLLMCHRKRMTGGDMEVCSFETGYMKPTKRPKNSNLKVQVGSDQIAPTQVLSLNKTFRFHRIASIQRYYSKGLYELQN
jgi:hypothetical protein